mmetsp:Transcript_22858/g.44460  ORF Transcript_22858/g.44460 Transcript_22858/m.44460 type:complete len:240 (-) Transcript_22858:1414-2133(-)
MLSGVESLMPLFNVLLSSPLVPARRRGRDGEHVVALPLEVELDLRHPHGLRFSTHPNHVPSQSGRIRATANRSIGSRLFRQINLSLTFSAKVAACGLGCRRGFLFDVCHVQRIPSQFPLVPFIAFFNVALLEVQWSLGTCIDLHGHLVGNGFCDDGVQRSFREVLMDAEEVDKLRMLVANLPNSTKVAVRLGAKLGTAAFSRKDAITPSISHDSQGRIARHKQPASGQSVDAKSLKVKR